MKFVSRYEDFIESSRHSTVLQKGHVFVIVDNSVNLSLILVFILKIDFRVKSQKRMLTTLVCVGKGIAKSRYR